MSRQDNFFLLKCLFIYIGGIYWYAMDINFLFFSLLRYGDICLVILLVRFFFLLCCTQAVFCAYLFI